MEFGLVYKFSVNGLTTLQSTNWPKDSQCIFGSNRHSHLIDASSTQCKLCVEYPSCPQYYHDKHWPSDISTPHVDADRSRYSVDRVFVVADATILESNPRVILDLMSREGYYSTGQRNVCQCNGWGEDH